MEHKNHKPMLGMAKDDKPKDTMHLVMRKKSLPGLKLDQTVTLTIRGKVTRLSHDEYGFCLDVEPVRVNVGNGGDTG
jgi:hypothetical protein